jgi:hypothetical protein
VPGQRGLGVLPGPDVAGWVVRVHEDLLQAAVHVLPGGPDDGVVPHGVRGRPAVAGRCGPGDVVPFDVGDLPGGQVVDGVDDRDRDPVRGTAELPAD